jgi:hypothetical protein
VTRLKWCRTASGSLQAVRGEKILEVQARTRCGWNMRILVAATGLVERRLGALETQRQAKDWLEFAA